MERQGDWGDTANLTGAGARLRRAYTRDSGACPLPGQDPKPHGKGTPEPRGFQRVLEAPEPTAWTGITEARGREGGEGILTLVLLAHLVLPGLMAFSD